MVVVHKTLSLISPAWEAGREGAFLSPVGQKQELSHREEETSSRSPEQEVSRAGPRAGLPRLRAAPRSLKSSWGPRTWRTRLHHLHPVSESLHDRRTPQVLMEHTPCPVIHGDLRHR